MSRRRPPFKIPAAVELWVQRLRLPAVCLVLAAITLVVFAQTTTFGFVNFDDGFYVFNNPRVTGGLSLKSVAWMLTHADGNLYHPLTMLSLMVDYQFHGVQAGGFHLTNVLLHTASVILLFLILHQMTGAFWRSAFVAALFAIHPLRVESVAWVSERKDVLGTFLFMLTLGAYVRHVRRPDLPGRYWMVAAAFALALLSKPTVVTLPFVLLLLDYWPLHRFEEEGPVYQTKHFKIPRRLILEKIPLLALAAVDCVLTVLAAGKEVAAYTHVSLLSRLGNAVVSYAVYLREMIWPAGLAAFYPRPENGQPAGTIVLSFFVLALITAGVVVFGRKRRWLLTGWLWYLGMLMPMIGLVQAGAFAHADRMTYLPQIGIYIALAWLAAEWRVNRAALAAVMIGALAALMVCAWNQTGYWRDSETLWNHALACTSRNDAAHYNLGTELLGQGRFDEAISNYQETLQIKPDQAEARNNLGNAFFQQGRADEAIPQFQEAIKIKPDFGGAHYNLATALRQKGRLDEAIAEYQKVLQINPGNADAEYNLATTLDQAGKTDEAREHFQKVLQIRPDFAEGLYNFGNDLNQKGKIDEAIAQFQAALQVKPDYAAAHVNLGSALLQEGRLDEAISHFQSALQFSPGNGQAHNNLGNALMQQGSATEAAGQFQLAMQIEPDDPWVKNNLAWLLATCPDAAVRNGSKAVELATEAARLFGGESPILLHTLAAALAEAGRFSEAVDTAQRALLLAEQQSKPRLAGQLQSELQLYQAGEPFHSPAAAH